jgi:hypothetical protein
VILRIINQLKNQLRNQRGENIKLKIPLGDEDPTGLTTKHL